MKEYDEITLHKVQQLELDILKEVDGICRKLDISYFAIAGTGIGVRRHKGFIPWDDDIDIGMMRADLSKLINYVKKNLNDKYIVINNDEFPEFPLMTTQLALKNTSFVVEYFKDINIPFGIYLDIFPFDNVPDDDFVMKFYGKRAWFYSKLLILRNVPKPYVTINGWKKDIIYFATSIINEVMKCFHISSRGLYIKAYKLSVKYNNMDTQRVGHFGCTKYDYFTMKRSDIFPLENCSFEDMEIMTPRAVERHLERMYGDYMQLPPKEKRKNHFPYKLDLGKYD